MKHHKRTTIFISYSHKDNEAAKKVSSLVNKYLPGYAIWIDKNNLHPADLIDHRISNNGVRQSDICLILLSPNSVQSESVYHELKLFLSKERKLRKLYSGTDVRIIIPILLEDCNIPTPLKKRLYLDFRKKIGYKELIRVISETESRIKDELNTEMHFLADPWEYDSCCKLSQVGEITLCKYHKDRLEVNLYEHIYVGNCFDDHPHHVAFRKNANLDMLISSIDDRKSAG